MKIFVIQETLMSYSDRAGFPITLCWLCFTWIDSICKGPLRNQTACRACAMVMWPWMKSMKSMIMKLVMQSTQKMTVYCIWPSVYPLFLPPCPPLISLTFTLSLSYISYINCTFRWDIDLKSPSLKKLCLQSPAFLVATNTLCVGRDGYGSSSPCHHIY